MLFPESFPITYSLILLLSISSSIFFWRFYSFKKKLIQEFKTSPFVLVTGVKGCGKTSFLNFLSNYRLSSFPLYEELKLATLDLGTSKINFLEIPYFVDGLNKDFKILKDMKIVHGIHIFDVSKNSLSIEDQIKHFSIIKEIFKDLKFIIIANKIDEADQEKLKKLEEEFGKVFKISLVKKEISKETSELLEKELEDVKKMISNLNMIETKTI